MSRIRTQFKKNLKKFLEDKASFWKQQINFFANEGVKVVEVMVF